MYIRQAEEKDVSRIAEILVYNNRVNFFPIFKDENYSFGELQVVSVANEYLQDRERLQNTFVYDNGLIRGFVQLSGPEIQKLYVDTFFQNQGIGFYAVNGLKTCFLPNLAAGHRRQSQSAKSTFHPTAAFGKSLRNQRKNLAGARNIEG